MISILAKARRMITATRPLKSLSRLNSASARRIMFEINVALRNEVAAMLRANFAASGLQTRTGTMQKAFDNPQFTITDRAVIVRMPSGLSYPNRANGGNPYAAMGKNGKDVTLWKLTPAQQARIIELKKKMLADRLKEYALEVK